MTTIINNPGEGKESSDSVLLAIIVLIIILVGGFLFFRFIIPLAQNNPVPTQEDQDIDVNVEVPKDIFNGGNQNSGENSAPNN